MTFFYKSPVGILKLTKSEDGLEEVTFIEESEFELMSGAQAVLPKARLFFSDVISQLDEYFAGKRTEFDLQLSPKGTAFQQQVWRALQTIPHGQVVSYKDIALKIKNPKAVRAVGGANGKNPLPIIVPCHRVVAHNGNLGGYSSGLDRKKWLLNHEGAGSFS